MKNQRNPARPLLGLILALVGLMCAVTLMLSTARLATAQAVGPSWSITGSLNTGRQFHTATLLPNGKVLVAGGNDSNRSFKSAELYDPATGTWNRTADLNTDRNTHTATLLQNGKVLVAGGFSCGPPPQSCFGLNSAELFDPATGTWSSTGNLNRIRDGHTATLLPNGRVLVVSGDENGNSAELYDPNTGTWSNTGNLNQGRGGHTATLLTNGKVLVAGGEDNNFSVISSAELYDPATETWSNTGNLNTARELHTATLLPNGKVLVAAGFVNFSLGQVTNSAELYDPSTGIWSGTGNLNQGRAYHTATLLAGPGGKVLVAGGFNLVNGFPNITDSAELYDPASGTWSNTATLNTARRFHTATLLLNGKVLAAGSNGFNAQNSAELYDAGTTTPGPNTVQFSSSSYTVSEGSPRVDITLSRSGDTTSSASVNFVTNDGALLQDCNVINGIASPRCDYIDTLGTMSFAAGETSKSFSVAIIDDGYAEGNETFTASLSSPSGATLGAQSTATVTINDNDSSNGTNPIDSTNFFVRQQYIDFLGREPDPPGFAGWTSTINNCSGDTTQCDRIHVSQLFFQSEEFQSRGYFIYRFYPVAFGRKPDYAEFVPDLARVSGFLNSSQLEAAKVAFIADFMARAAFANTYNGLTNQQYVDALLNTAGVTLSSRQAMIDGLNNSTMTRAQVLRQIVESAEVSTKYNHQAFAVMEYFGYLRRQPDALYLDWITVLDQSNDPRGMVTGFVNSAEYRQRFGP
jgi:N-acetylneuraminic acid mutarotase